MRNKPTYREIHFSKLILDSQNPRIPKSKHDLKGIEIINFLLLEAATLELMQAIGENDFFQGEQLLVVPVIDDKYKVLEGNRRLASVLLLNNPELATVKTASVRSVYENAKFRPQEIPCLVFNDEAKVRKYLGFRHITGIKPWGLSEKARYLHQLFLDMFEGEKLNLACGELAKIIGSRRDYVKRVIIAYMLFRIVEDEGFYGIRDLNDTTFYVGYLSDSLSHSNIARYIGIDLSSESPIDNVSAKNLKKLIHWFFEKNEQNKTRIKGKSADLNKLNAILDIEKSNNAFKAFAEDGRSLDSAYELTEDIDSLLKLNIMQALRKLEDSDSITHKVNTFYDGLDDDLIQIRKLTTKIQQTKDEFAKSGCGYE